MRTVNFFDVGSGSNLGIFKSSFHFLIGDDIAINEKVYRVIKTLKYVYQDAEEVEHVLVSIDPVVEENLNK